jgi:hypothetical protein
MPSARASGTAFIAGTIAGIITMAFHPASAEIIRGTGDADAVAMRNVLVHTLGITGAWITLLGGIGLTERLREASTIAHVGLVSFLAATVAVTLAAIASGFLGTDVAIRAAAAEPDAREALLQLFWYTGAINQAFAKMHVVASSIGIGAWSVAIMRTGGLSKRAATAGLLVAAACVTAVLAGLQLDIHGFGAIVLAQAIWYVWIGLALRADRPADATP